MILNFVGQLYIFQKTFSRYYLIVISKLYDLMSLLKCEMWPNAFLTAIQDSSSQTCKAGCNNQHSHSSARDFTENNWLKKKKSSNKSIHFPGKKILP